MIAACLVFLGCIVYRFVLAYGGSFELAVGSGLGSMLLFGLCSCLFLQGEKRT